MDGLLHGSEEMTRRLLTAIDHPYVNIIGHPTTRVLGRPTGSRQRQETLADFECSAFAPVFDQVQNLEMDDVRAKIPARKSGHGIVSSAPEVTMCYPVRCRACGKTGWAGCGQHVNAVLRDVPASERCTCQADTIGHGVLTAACFGPR